MSRTGRQILNHWTTNFKTHLFASSVNKSKLCNSEVGSIIPIGPRMNQSLEGIECVA